jgi:hypothetical protein
MNTVKLIVKQRYVGEEGHQRPGNVIVVNEARGQYLVEKGICVVDPNDRPAAQPAQRAAAARPAPALDKAGTGGKENKGEAAASSSAAENRSTATPSSTRRGRATRAPSSAAAPASQPSKRASRKKPAAA